MNEAALTLVMKMRDEASAGMQSFGRTLGESQVQGVKLGTSLNTASGDISTFSAKAQTAQIAGMRLNMALTAMGSALSSVGSLIGKVDSPAAKMVSNFLMSAGAIMASVSAIVTLLPYISHLISSLKTLAVWQTITKALSGPAGWAMLAGGVAVGAAATYGISSMASSPRTPGTTINNYIQGSVVTERQISEITRREIVKSQGRNAGTSGIQ